MMKRVKLSTCAKWLALGLLVVVNSSYAASRVKTAAQAIQCQPDTQENGYNGTCPYPADLYRADPVWKKIWNRPYSRRVSVTYWDRMAV
jgi:hypothetical protein